VILNCFVTGGSRGIGRAIVLKLVASGYGCAFTFVGNAQGAEETVALARAAAPNAKVLSYRLDVRDPAAVEKTAEKAISELGDVHVVVNNAAIVRNNAMALMADDEWVDVIATNLSGPFYVTRSFLMHFLSNRFGRIVNISSLAAGGSSGQANYSAAKAGLEALTKTVAKEYGPKNITANAVVVGYVQTAMTDNHLSDQLRNGWVRYCPAKRVGTAEEVASLVHYLTTEHAGFINGEVIRVSGGLTYAP
jgi:3-oxoacyl-[acyl-carrier protein] reductase